MRRTSLLSAAVRKFERSFLLVELTRNGWNRTRTARDLGISYRGLLHKITLHGLRPNELLEQNRVEDCAKSA